MLLDQTGRDHAVSAAERLRHFVQENVLVVDDHAIPMTVSVGVATSVDKDRSFNDLLRRADHALYAAKTAGRNRVEIADDSSDGQD